VIQNRRPESLSIAPRYGGTLLVPACVVLLGVLLAAGSLEISFGAGYDRIGPRFFPFVVAGGLILLGGLLLLDAWRTRRGEGSPEIGQAADCPVNWTRLGWLVLALVSGAVLLEPVGFVLGAAVLFWLSARAFGSRHPVRDAAVAVAFSTAVFLSFTRGLGLMLPPGILRGLF